jgi:PAS domain
MKSRDAAPAGIQNPALSVSEERYRSLLNSIDVGFCVVEILFDDDGSPVDFRFLETNPALEKQSGLSDAVDKCVRTLVPELEAHWFETYGRVAPTGEEFRRMAPCCHRFEADGFFASDSRSVIEGTKMGTRSAFPLRKANSLGHASRDAIRDECGYPPSNDAGTTEQHARLFDQLTPPNARQKRGNRLAVSTSTALRSDGRTSPSGVATSGRGPRSKLQRWR